MEKRRNLAACIGRIEAARAVAAGVGDAEFSHQTSMQISVRWANRLVPVLVLLYACAMYDRRLAATARLPLQVFRLSTWVPKRSEPTRLCRVVQNLLL